MVITCDVVFYEEGNSVNRNNEEAPSDNVVPTLEEIYGDSDSGVDGNKESTNPYSEDMNENQAPYNIP